MIHVGQYLRDPLAVGETRNLFCVLMISSIIMTTFLKRITIDSEQCGGRPCIRSIRIRVSDVLDLFAAGLSAAQILSEMPDLQAEDLQACMTFASRRIDHPMLAA